MTIHIDTVEAFERELDKRLNGLRVKLANGSTIALSKYLLAQIRDARRGRMRAEEALTSIEREVPNGIQIVAAALSRGGA